MRKNPPLPPRSHYLLESPLEAGRLEARADLQAAEEQLRLVGLQEGMEVLDAGAGTCWIARVMSRIVGPRGRVWAFDGSEERLQLGARKAQEQGCANLRFVTGDLYQPPFQPGSFDLVWSRLVLEHLSDPDLALARLVELAKPGGKVVAGDIDGAGGFHYPCPTWLRQGLEKLESFLQERADPYAGRKLFHRFRRAGLEQIHVHLLPHHLYAGEAPVEAVHNWDVKFQTLRPVGTLAFGGAERYEEFVRAFLDLLKDPDVFTYSLFFLVEGVRARRTSR